MKSAERDPRPKIRELTPGQVVGGKYRIERQLGAGGMGIVVAANDIQLRRKVAIKVMAPTLAADDASVKRFLREARAVVTLTGEHIVRVFDVGELASGIPYIAMEFLVGTDLDTVCAERGRLPVREAVDLLLQAMKGLVEAHAAGIVHRDLKPANLFLTRRSDGTPLVKVLDFGLAKATEVLADETKLTGTNVVMGTQQYMSPEQLLAREVNARSDIWALGVCLYQLTTGILPFDAPVRLDGQRRPNVVVLGEISRRICKETPRAPHEIVSDIPLGLSSVMMRCLEKDQARRFTNVADLANALEGFASPEFKGLGLRLETVLEGQTLAFDMQAARAQLAPDTIPDSSVERTTEKMHGGAFRRALNVAEAAVRTALARIRRAFENVDAARARSFISAFARDRRAILIVGVTAFALTLMLMFAVVMLNERARRAATTTSASDPSQREGEMVPAASMQSAASLNASTPPVSASASAAPPATSASVATVASPRKEAATSPSSTSNIVERAPPEPDETAADAAGAPAAHTTRPPPSAPHPPTTAATSAQKANCTPPFVKHPDGKVVWKVECL